MKIRTVSLISTEMSVVCHGLRVISSVLKARGHQTKVLFLGTEKDSYPESSLKEIRDAVRGADIIGLSSYSRNTRKARQLIKYLGSEKIPVIWGGCHATLNPDQCIKYADYVCVGEGEKAIADLVDNLHDPTVCRTIPNLWVRQAGKIYKNDPSPLNEALDELPLEDYEPSKKYFLMSNGHLKRGRHDAGLEMQLKSKMIRNLDGVSFILSRGCPHSCKLCYMYDLKKLYKGRRESFYRQKSIAASIKEIVYLKDRFGLSSADNFISFHDDDFFARTADEIKEFSHAYKEKVGIPFGCQLHINSFTEEKFKMLLDAGLKAINTGVQSGSPEVLRNIYCRTYSEKSVLDAAHIINNHADKFYKLPAYMLVNANPYEQEDDAWKSVDLIKKMKKPFRLTVFQMTFYPNSALARQVIDDGLIQDESELAYEEHYCDAVSFYRRRRKRYLYSWAILNIISGAHSDGRRGTVSEDVFNILTGNIARNLFGKNALAKALIVRCLFWYLNRTTLTNRRKSISESGHSYPGGTKQ